jgi:hypothetical protein
MHVSRLITLAGSLLTAFALAVAVPAGAAAASQPSTKQLEAVGLTGAKAADVRRNPQHLMRYMRTWTTSFTTALASRVPGRGCVRRRTQVNYGFSDKVFRAAWYRISMGWCWNKRNKRVIKDGPIRTDWHIRGDAAVLGLRHKSDQVRESGYYRWKNARRGGYLAQGELVLHVCPIVEFSCGPTDRLVGLVAGHYDGSVTRRGYRR